MYDNVIKLKFSFSYDVVISSSLYHYYLVLKMYSSHKKTLNSERFN